MYIYSIFVPAPPYSQIEREEFPFKLVYECDGEQRTIEGALICEFAGMECDSNFKKHRMWTYYDSDDADIEEMPISKKKLLSKYGITLISWDCKASIKNTFRQYLLMLDSEIILFEIHNYFV